MLTRPSTAVGSMPLSTLPAQGAQDRADRRARLKGLRGAVRCERRLESDRRLRPIAVVAHVLLASPDELDWPAHGLCHRDRLDQLVVHRPPAEASAQEAVVNLDVPGRHAGRPGGELEGGVGVLRSHPHLDPVTLDMGGAVQRLHRGVGQMGHLVGRLDALALRERGVDVALLAGGDGRPVEGRAIGRVELLAVGLGGRSLLPGDWQHQNRLLGPPEAIGHDRQPAWYRHHRPPRRADRRSPSSS